MTVKHQQLQLGLLPPLRLSEARHPRNDRRAVNLRWLAGAAVFGLASCLLLTGVLRTALKASAHFERPTLAILTTAARGAASFGLGDKLPWAAHEAPAASPTAVVAQTVQSSGLGDKPLTIVTARLGQLDDSGGSEDGSPAPVAAPGPTSSAGAPARVVARGSSLPPLILFGAARPSAVAAMPPASTASYAAVSPVRFVEPGPAGTPLNVTTLVRTPAIDPVADHVRTVVAQRGDTAARLLAPFGLSSDDIADVTAVIGAGSFAGGEKILIRSADDPPPAAHGRPIEIGLEGNGQSLAAGLTDAGSYRLVATTTAARPTADVPSLEAPADDDVDGSIRDKLGALDGKAGVEQTLVSSLIRVLGADRDLGQSVAADDTIEVLYGKDPEGGDPDLDYAALTLHGRTERFYRYASADDASVDYYDQDGRSLTKFLLRKPVANGRLGDGFGWRVHPILRDRRFHEGVDYAAPYGSPVVAAGAGTVEKIDFESGYGKYIRVRHDLGYETTYAHVSGFPRGMAVGRRVQQGQTIAYIGSTGLSTGPHLYYEVKINDHNVDPLTIKLAAGRILQGSVLTDFQRRRDRIDVLLKASRPERG